MRLSLLVILASLLLCQSAHAQNVQIALDGAADLSPVYPTLKIPANARQFVAIFMLPDKAHHKVDALMSPVAAGGSSVAYKQGQTEVLTIIDKSRVLLRYFFQSDLPVGQWLMTVKVDEKPFASQSFEVIPAVAPLNVASPIDLAGSLAKGTEWTSEVRTLEEPRPGLKISLDDINQAGPDGWLRTTAVRRIVAIDRDGVRFENYRGGKLLGSAWTIATDRGLAIVKMQAEGRTSVATPPELMVSWPLTRYRTSWQWHDTRQQPQASHQFQIWGPLPIKTPNGEQQGYVMLQKVPKTTDPAVIENSTESGIVPGLGIVYTVDIQYVPRYQTALRTETHLTSMKHGSGPEPEIRKYAESSGR